MNDINDILPKGSAAGLTVEQAYQAGRLQSAKDSYLAINRALGVKREVIDASIARHEAKRVTGQ